MKKLIFVSLIMGFLSFPMLVLSEDNVPDFRQFKDIKQKKMAFFEFMLPHIQKANADIKKTRAFLKGLSPRELIEQKSQLISLARYYRVPYKDQSLPALRKKLLNKVDVIPVSLALAQAANESAWGTSRFARKASNYFGQWCLIKGCGLVPARRKSGETHEVRKFDSAYESVKSYMHHLNAQPLYKKMREIRLQQKLKHQRVKGLDLVEGLEFYSARKFDYIKELSSMIRINQLDKYDL